MKKLIFILFIGLLSFSNQAKSQVTTEGFHLFVTAYWPGGVEPSNESKAMIRLYDPLDILVHEVQVTPEDYFQSGNSMARVYYCPVPINHKGTIKVTVTYNNTETIPVMSGVGESLPGNYNPDTPASVLVQIF